MKTIKQIFIAFALFNGTLFSYPKAVQGILDLSGWEINENFLTKLDGEWEFYYKELLEPKDLEDRKKIPQYIFVPSKWNDLGYPEDGYATYRLVVKNFNPNSFLGIRLPHMNSSYRLYVNGKEIAKNGQVAQTIKEFIPQHLPQVVFVYPQKDSLEVVLQVTNFSDNIGGVWDSIYLGNSKAVVKAFWKSLGLEMFYIGFISIMSFYHFALYILRKKEKGALYFAIFCLVIVIRIFVTGEKILLQIFPNFPWELHIKIEYLTVYLALPIFSNFLMYQFNENNKKKFFEQTKNWSLYFKEEFYYPLVVAINIISFIFALSSLFFKVKFYGNFLKYYQIFIVVSSLYLIYGNILAIKKTKQGSLISFLGSVIFFFIVLNDILYAKHILHTVYLLPLGFFIFILFQSLSLAKRFANTFFLVENLSFRYGSLIRVFEKFVPKEFLYFLKKEDISGIALGDQVSQEMAVMFADIRNFSKLSEQLSEKENFEFVNQYLSYVVPVVKKNFGFIDKYLGDGFLALFPASPENALEAAIEIQNNLKLLNEELKDRNIGPIQVRIGIHYGKVMLGVVGNSERLETTVISDTVNTCSRLEKLNKDFGTDILISDALWNLVKNKEHFKNRFLGTSILRGKTTTVKILEIFNHYDLHLVEKMESYKKKFYEAIKNFSNNEIQKSIETLEEILKINPYDNPARYYHFLCRRAMNFDV
ncbi:MAG: 7TM diverse intracellular signaling domain-containing protein [Leptonema sp. (in: bacteria)]